MAQKKTAYGNDSISALKGADRVRKRPGVIFGSDGLEGCEHAVFEIMSNAIDEAREGHGTLITVTRFADRSIQVEDQGRGCPVDWNEKEQKFNWELVFCELYAGGKYGGDGDNYEYSLGLNGLGSCATQYASEYFDAVIVRDGFQYTLHFEKGENVGGLKKEPAPRGKKTGSTFRWKPDLEVFTDIDIPADYYLDVMKRQAVVNAGITFRFRNQIDGKFEITDFRYDNGIADYVAELAGEDALTQPVFWQAEHCRKALHLLLLFQQAAADRALSQLLLAGAWRLSGKGREAGLCRRHRRPAQAGRKISEVRIQSDLQRHSGRAGAGEQQLFHPDQLREPDQKGHQQPVRPGRDG